jgi:excisionase family DNA binding protein
MKWKLSSELVEQQTLVQQASSFEDSKCMSPEFIDELAERIVQKIHEKKDNELEFYTINEVASVLKVSRATVERRIREKELKTYKFGGNIRISKSDLMSFLDSASP